MMILEWGSEPVYHAWPGQPLYRVLKLSQVIDSAPKILVPNMHVRVELDIDISYEEANFIKDTFVKDYHLREMALIPVKSSAVDADMAPGEVKVESFGGFDRVFSGHFHLRQQKKNINYIGNCFPHNYADAGDADRGMMMLEWGSEPVYHAWPGQPLYRVLKLSQVIDSAPKILVPNMHVRVELDIDISYEEANFIKDTFVKDYNLREMALIPVKSSAVDADMAPGEVKFESVDQIVTDQLTNIESEFYDPKLLLKIYQNL